MLLIGANAQSTLPAAVNWGDQTPAPPRSELLHIIGGGQWGAYALRLQKNRRGQPQRLLVEQYDQALRLRRRSTIPAPDFQMEKVYLIDGRLFVLGVRQTGRPGAAVELVVQPLDERMEATEPPRVLTEVSADDRYRPRLFDLVFSRDSSHVLIYQQPRGGAQVAEEFALRVFDGQFRPLWSRTVTLRHADRDFAVRDYGVDGQGRVYVLGHLGGDPNHVPISTDTPHRYFLSRYTATEEQEVDLDVPDRLLSDLAFEVNDAGGIYCVGFYSEESTHTARGVYFLKLDAQMQALRVPNMAPLDLSFLARAQLDNPLTGERTSPELYHYRIRELYPRPDGGAVLVAEQYWEEESLRQARAALGLAPDVYFNYLDILVVRVGADGGIVWSTRLPKRQESVNDGGYYASFASATVQDRLYFLYNVHRRSFATGDWSRYNLNSRSSVLALAEVGLDGQVQLHQLVNHDNVGVVTRPRLSRQIGGHRMLIVGNGKRSYRLGEVVFD